MECSLSKWSGVSILLGCQQHIWGSTLSNFAKVGSIFFYIYINIRRQCWGLKFEVEVQIKIFCTTKLLAPSVVPVCVGQVSVLCLVGTWSNFAFVFSTLLHFISLTSSLLPPWCLFPSPPSPSLPQDHCSGTCSHLSSEDDWLPISTQTHLPLPSLLLVFKGLHWSGQVARAKNKGVTLISFQCYKNPLILVVTLTNFNSWLPESWMTFPLQLERWKSLLFFHNRELSHLLVMTTSLCLMPLKFHLCTVSYDSL